MGYGRMGLTKAGALREKKLMQKKGYIGVTIQKTPEKKGFRYDMRYKKYKKK